MSALDARIRKLAREEAERLSADAPAAVLESPGPDRVAALEKEMAELRGDLKRAYARLDALTPAETDERPAARRTRKTAGSE